MFSRRCNDILTCIKQARDLVPRDFSGTADPFCRLRLLSTADNDDRPQGVSGSQRQSRVHRRTLFPEFEEVFVFDVGEADLNRSTLEILVLDYDRFSREECVGRVLYPLLQVAPVLITPTARRGAKPQSIVVWKDLSMCDKGHDVSDIYNTFIVFTIAGLVAQFMSLHFSE